MRLITGTIHRAFPELDRYSDEQCIRFIRAARGGKLRRAFGLAILIVFTSLLLVGVVFALLWFYEFRGGRYEPTWRAASTLSRIIGIAAAVFAIAIPPLAAAVLRDIMLRRRVRFVLRSRGTCTGCGYSLVGLPIDSRTRVKCPECGVETEVDPSLGELVLDDAGQRRFQPHTGGRGPGAGSAPRFWTPDRTRRLRKSMLWTLAVSLVALVFLAGAYEIFLRVQARAAAKARPRFEGLMAVIESHQPPDGPPGSPDAWQALLRADEITRKVDDKVWAAEPRDRSQPRPDFTLIFDPSELTNPRRTEAERLEAAASRDLALRLLPLYDQAGLAQALREMAASRRAVPVPEINGQDAMVLSMSLPYLGRARHLARICAARATIAAREGDIDAYFDSIESGLALARVTRHGPTMIEGLVADAIERLMLERLTMELVPARSAEWAGRAAQVLDRQRTTLPPDYMFIGEGVVLIDAAGWIFSDPHRVRFGKYSPRLVRELWNNSLDNVHDGWLGTFAQNKRAFEIYTATNRATATTPPFLRGIAGTRLPPVPSNLALMNYLQGATSRAISTQDALLTQRLGLRTIAAIELFRHQTGAYPDRLEQLSPEYLPKPPIDPWSGNALGYKRIDPAADRLGRSYLLYSIGADRNDDGGKEQTDEEIRKTSPSQRAYMPADDVLNRKPDPPRN